MPTDEYKKTVLNRALGHERNGEVTVRSYDEGIVETMGAKLYTVTGGKLAETDAERKKSHYCLVVDGVAPPPGMPGVPVVFQYPEEVFERQRLPYIMVNRDDIATAIQRWHPGTQQYRTGSRTANPVYVEGLTGHDTYEERPQGEPVDITYSLTIMTDRRGIGSRSGLELLWYHVRKVYKPYGYVIVKDSLGDLRTYNAFRESEMDMTDIPGISERLAGMTLTVRVEAELDNEDPVIRKAVTSRPNLRTRLR